MLQGSPSTLRTQPRLPGRLTPFVGRRLDLEGVLTLLQDPSVRLITLCGMGGVGKTALALELLSRLSGSFQHGAAFVPLAQLSTVDELLPALAQALDVQLPPSGDLQQALLDQLSDLHLLLVLDSFEHLVDEAALVRDILLAAPRVKVLVTSREKLSLQAEVLYTLRGLDLPAPDDLPDAPPADAVSLFLQRARQVRPHFSLTADNSATVAQLCRLVDGNALGILLAASWLEHFSPSEILAEAAASLDFLTHRLRDVEARHTGLRALFESSFRRLDERQKAVFRRLSVFRGGFDLPAAQAVAAADLVSLISLVEKSMLARDPESGRYQLHALLQQYAREELVAAAEFESTLAAHTAYYADFVREREPRMASNLQAPALDEIQADLDNIRQAWSTLIARRDFQAARLMLPGLYAFCDMRSRFIEGEAMFRHAAQGLAPQAGELPHGAWALALLSWYDMHSYIEHLDSYVELAAQARWCLACTQADGDPQGEAASHVLLGAIRAHERDFKAAISFYEAAMRLYPALADVYWVDMRIGLTHEAAREYDAAIRAFQWCLQRSRATGERVKQGWSHQNIGDSLRFQGKTAEAQTYLEQARDLFREIGTRDGVLWATYSLSHVASDFGKRGRALELAHESSRIAHLIHSPSWIRETDQWLRQLDPQQAAAPASGAQAFADVLSERELEVLQLLKSELTGPEIAARLVVSLNTVRFHTKHIYQKLGVGNRLEAIRRAKELGL